MEGLLSTGPTPPSLLINDKAVCKRAPATPGLLIMFGHDGKRMNELCLGVANKASLNF